MLLAAKLQSEVSFDETPAPCHHDRGKLTTHYKYITAEKKVLLCKIETVTCRNKNQICGIFERLGQAIFDKDRRCIQKENRRRKFPAARITVFLFCWFYVLETMFIVRV